MTPPQRRNVDSASVRSPRRSLIDVRYRVTVDKRMETSVTDPEGFVQ